MKHSVIVIFIWVSLSACVTVTEDVGTRLAEAQEPELAELTRQQAQQQFIPGSTRQAEVSEWFGRPGSVSQSGEQQFWNYTHREQHSGYVEMVNLSLVFGPDGVLQDYHLEREQFELSD